MMITCHGNVVWRNRLSTVRSTTLGRYFVGMITDNRAQAEAGPVCTRISGRLISLLVSDVEEYDLELRQGLAGTFGPSRPHLILEPHGRLLPAMTGFRSALAR